VFGRGEGHSFGGGRWSCRGTAGRGAGLAGGEGFNQHHQLAASTISSTDTTLHATNRQPEQRIKPIDARHASNLARHLHDAHPPCGRPPERRTGVFALAVVRRPGDGKFLVTQVGWVDGWGGWMGGVDGWVGQTSDSSAAAQQKHQCSASLLASHPHHQRVATTSSNHNHHDNNHNQQPPKPHQRRPHRRSLPARASGCQAAAWTPVSH